jgi:Ca-activated chloride channel homolog
MFSLAAPYAILLLPLAWVAARYFVPRAQSLGALRIPASVAAQLPPDDAEELGSAARSILPWLIWLALIAALAGPRIAVESPALPASGRDIVLALDLSGSMEKIDFDLDGKPAKRIDVVKRAASAFVRSRAGDRIGLVIFAEKAYFAAAPTFDVEAVARAIDESVIGISGKSTAISDGLGLALKRLADSKAASRVVILLSDGVNNGGSVRPSDAAALSKKLGVRVHTIAMGKRDLETDKTDPDVVDTAALRLIANASGGTAFRVKESADFDAVSKSINDMEASAVEVPTALVFKDYWIWPALLAFAGAMALLIGQRRLA